MIANISRIANFNECRQKEYYWNEKKLSALREDDPLLIGGGTHEGIAEFLANRNPNRAIQVAEESYRARLKDTLILPEERGKLEQNIELTKRMVAQFCHNYSESDLQVLWPEVEFCVPLPNSLHHCLFFHRILHPNIPFKDCPVQFEGQYTNGIPSHQCMQPIYFQGKTDAVVQYKGSIWLLEHKTSAMTGNIFYDKFFLDFQPTGYLYGIGKAIGTTPHGFILNVLKKPPKNARDQFAISFEREAYVRSDEDLERFEREFILQAQDYEDAFIRDRIYMNTRSCTAWNRRCYYWDTCKRHGSYGPEEFKQRDPDYVDKNYYKILGLPFPGDIVFQVDGNMWMASRPNFINIQESLAGFGLTRELAKGDLERQEKEAENV